jgi:hypothetical protein
MGNVIKEKEEDNSRKSSEAEFGVFTDLLLFISYLLFKFDICECFGSNFWLQGHGNFCQPHYYLPHPTPNSYSELEKIT